MLFEWLIDIHVFLTRATRALVLDWVRGDVVDNALAQPFRVAIELVVIDKVSTPSTDDDQASGPHDASLNLRNSLVLRRLDVKYQG